MKQFATITVIGKDKTSGVARVTSYTLGKPRRREGTRAQDPGRIRNRFYRARAVHEDSLAELCLAFQKQDHQHPSLVAAQFSRAASLLSVQARGLFQIGTSRFISSISHWVAANASPRCGATTSTQSEGSFTWTVPIRCTRRTDSIGQRRSI